MPEGPPLPLQVHPAQPDRPLQGSSQASVCSQGVAGPVTVSLFVHVCSALDEDPALCLVGGPLVCH